MVADCVRYICYFDGVRLFLLPDPPLRVPRRRLWPRTADVGPCGALTNNTTPCRLDSSYLHIIEPIIGAGLFGATIGLLGWLMHDFNVFTILAASIAFAEVNLHNHDRMETDRFPYKYLKYASDMHHVHHKRFDSGNFATITLFYDWLFGTYDTGLGWGKKKRAPKSQ